MKTKPRILFLSHSASRNGATILLLHLLRWLKNAANWEIAVLVNGSGPLVDEFRDVAETTIWRSPVFLLNAFPKRKAASLQMSLESQCLKALLVGRRFDLIYANTIATFPLVKALGNRAPALLWHIHELGYALRLSIGEKAISELAPPNARFVAASSSVRDTLLYEFNVREDRVDLIHEFVPAAPLDTEEQRSRRDLVRRELGWPPDVFVVGGCGSLGWRKGTDLFLQIAHAVKKSNGSEKIRFLWVGGGAEDKEALEFGYDLRALDLQGCCHRISATSDAYRYYSAMDVLALTSREDPFPLVMLEAGSHGVPTVCFADSGGGPEFVGTDAGLSSPYLDSSMFAANLMRLYDQPHLCKRLGAAALAKVRSKYVVEVQAPKLQKIIERCLAIPVSGTVG